MPDPARPLRLALRPDPPVVCPGFGFEKSVYIEFRLFVLPKNRPGRCLRFAGGQGRGQSPGRIDSTASRPIQPRSPSPPHRAPPRPDWREVCPGFDFDRWRVVQATFLRCLVECGGGLSPGQTILLAPSPARPRPAAPPCAPTRPSRGMSGFWTRQLVLYMKRPLRHGGPATVPAHLRTH